jgi:hypothetical protein
LLTDVDELVSEHGRAWTGTAVLSRWSEHDVVAERERVGLTCCRRPLGREPVMHPHR